jgi:tRNA pseudouridine65 synthase
VSDAPTDPSARDGVFPVAKGDGWVVVAKPPRVLVHRNAMFPRERAMLQRVRTWARRRVYPIHRLDRNTSGCLLFATEQSLAGPLSAALADAEKIYVCLVRGDFPHDEPVTVDTPVKLAPGEYRDAESVVEKLAGAAEPRSSLLRVRPRTGRTHQVRRHVRDLHHPIVHDGAHGDSRVNRWWRENRGATRLQLHCLRLDMALPGGGRLQAVSPLFDDLAGVWSALPYWAAACEREPDLTHAPLPVPPDLAGEAP